MKHTNVGGKGEPIVPGAGQLVRIGARPTQQPLWYGGKQRYGAGRLRLRGRSPQVAPLALAAPLHQRCRPAIPSQTLPSCCSSLPGCCRSPGGGPARSPQPERVAPAWMHYGNASLFLRVACFMTSACTHLLRPERDYSRQSSLQDPPACSLLPGRPCTHRGKRLRLRPPP